jgi:pimeloyl-ACP methyl ester carboxylesterase
MTAFLLCLVAAVALVYAAASWRLYAVQGSRIFRPLRDIVATPADHGLAYDEVGFDTADGLRLNGWYVPRAGARYLLMFFHGNTRNISHCLDSVLLFHRLGFNVFLFDYRGYGRSEGEPSEQGTYADAEAAWRYLASQRGAEPGSTVMLGRSLGAAIASWLAARRPPRLLVLESTFTSLPEVAAERYPWLPARLLARHHYPVARHLPRIHCPVLILHSREDEVIGFHHGTRLYEAANPPKEFLEIAGRHYDGYRTSGARYADGLAAFFDRYLGDRTA